MFILSMIAMVGCDEPSPIGSDSPNLSIESATGIDDEVTQRRYSGEAHFVDIASEEPTFAGMFVENGKLVVTGTDPGRDGSLIGAVEARRADIQRSEAIEVRTVDFTFHQLANWRNLASRHLQDQWTTLDLDERANRIAIGVPNEDGTERVLKSMLDLGVPEEAVSVRVVPSATPGGRSSALRWDPNTFHRKDRPVPAGYRIKVADNNGLIEECTIGLMTRLQSTGQAIMVTASHCTDEVLLDDAAADSTAAYQRSETGSDTYLGLEVDDPTYSTCGSLRCRDSDAVSFSIPQDSADHGGIVRPRYRRSGWPVPVSGRTEVDPADKRLRIHNYIKFPIQGSAVDKVGSVTGWTTGEIEATCQDRTFTWTPNYKITCAYDADFYSQGGDSGGPVFVWVSGSDSVSILGIVTGWDDDDTRSFFSPIRKIQEELGDMQLEDAVLSVAIPGPWEASPNEPCTFYSNPRGGRIPYTYSWSGVLTGTTKNVTGTVSSSGNLTVTVTDADNNTASDTRFIDVDQFNFCVY